MTSIRRLMMSAVMSVGLLAGGAEALAAGGSLGGGMPGPKSPTGAPTPVAGPGGSLGSAKRPNATSGSSSTGAVALDSEEDAAKRQLAMEKWTTYVEAVQPGFVAIGAVRELPFGFRAGVGSGMLLVTPTFLGELQTPSIHLGSVRLYAAGAGAWMYVPRVKVAGNSARAYGFGPKVGFEWRLPMHANAAHGWHVGADAGLLYGDWSPIFGTKFRRSMPTFTPLRVGYYW